jgi:hypothetical protein
MPFVRKKTRQTKRYSERTYYYAVETYRDDGKVKQRTVGYLGLWPTIAENITHEHWVLFYARYFRIGRYGWHGWARKQWDRQERVALERIAKLKELAPCLGQDSPEDLLLPGSQAFEQLKQNIRARFAGRSKCTPALLDLFCSAHCLEKVSTEWALRQEGVIP